MLDYNGVQINLTLPADEVRAAMLARNLELWPGIPRKVIAKMVLGSTQWLCCPATQARVDQMACMFCGCGHMTECHYPLDCEEAQCGHYLASQQAETGFEEFGDDDEEIAGGFTR